MNQQMESSLAAKAAGEVQTFGKNKGAELRGCWVATVKNLDFPGKDVGSEKCEVQFKEEFLKILETCRMFGLNAVFVQVRPEGDAFYPSAINPWSRFLTGVQGVSPGFDPLKWMIGECRPAGVEFHAWLNPYRVTAARFSSREEALASLCNSHPARKSPDELLFFDGKLMYDPGVPAVRAHICETVEEILAYEVDAIHFDDYFYPYPIEQDGGLLRFSDTGLDWQSYEHYGGGACIHQWRQDNISKMIEAVYKTIQQRAEFGVSPYGIWAHESEHPAGSKTSLPRLGTLSEYADTRAWVEAGWLDYIVPQLYWSCADPHSSFEVLCRWWDDLAAGHGTRLYLGLGLYHYDEAELWQDPEEIVRQVQLSRNLPHTEGLVLFRYQNLVEDHLTKPVLGQALSSLRKLLPNP